ncbi:MAG: hypothetical protein WC457_00485 [Patescibacteria group bacterium]
MADKNGKVAAYKKLVKDYGEWNSLMNRLEKDELDLRRKFSAVSDQAKMEDVKKKIKQ